MQAENRLPAAPLVGLLALCASCAALLLALCPPSAQAAACPNEAVRAEQGAAASALPDCRAYELVSPGSTPTLSAESKVGFGGGKASPAGDALSYFSRYPAKGSVTSSETWLSTRIADGWRVESLDPQKAPTPTKIGFCLPGVALSEELDAYLLSAGGELYSSGVPNPTGECGVLPEELVPGEPRGYSNLYLRTAGSPYQLVNPVPIGETPGNATYQAASSDLSRIVFSENAQLTPESQAGFNLFEWADGAIRLVGVLPNGEPVPAQLGAATENWGISGGGTLMGLAPVSHAVSADGERVFFEANGSLYLRENAGQAPAANASCLTTIEPELACTLRLDRSLGAGSDGGGVFQFASRDGERVFFTSDHALTFPSSAQAGKPDLYEYDVSARKITDLTVGPGGAANVRGISGGADDGSRLYFVARGALTGVQQNGRGEIAQSGQPNLYLLEEGSLTYVATLSPWEASSEVGGMDKHNWWDWELGSLKTAWSPSGAYLAFSSFKSLTGFDNSPAEAELCAGASICEELFLYDADLGELSCISCDPRGSKPLDHTRMVSRQEFKRFGFGPRYGARAVLDSGQVFFDTDNSLTSQDVNGSQDTYEFHAGKFNLISSGTAKGGSAFVDTSADGSNVFFITPESLVRRDVDGGLPSIYDARIDGGFAEPPLPLSPCATGEECRPAGPPSPPVTSAGTVGFSGAGNVKPKRCKHGKVRRGGKCVKRKAHRRHHKRRQGGKNRGSN